MRCPVCVGNALILCSGCDGGSCFRFNIKFGRCVTVNYYVFSADMFFACIQSSPDVSIIHDELMEVSIMFIGKHDFSSFVAASYGSPL